MGKKSSLKAALSSHQARTKKKQDAKQAALVAEQKGKKPLQSKAKGRALASTTIPFKPTDKILLIGEGNFSFARALLFHPPVSLQHLPPCNVIATAYDSEIQCYDKYPEAVEIVKDLRTQGAEILFRVDATKLEKHPSLRGRKFDKIMWNFPHAGKGLADQDRNILANQMLLLGFLSSVPHVLQTGAIPFAQARRKRMRKGPGEDPDDAEHDSASETEDVTQDINSRGTVLITLRNVAPYTMWDLPKLAKSPPPPSKSGSPPNPRYVQLRSFAFHRNMWKGYEHRMTKGERAHGKGTTGVGGEDRTWEFYLKD
ncbi:hypothetical protein BC835DRAFT_1280414 [Cytidiella melzeri]|nr:hypothetical protein BC835DRAFT_1280414 [Cytidiella melzeri]